MLLDSEQLCQTELSFGNFWFQFQEHFFHLFGHCFMVISKTFFLQKRQEPPLHS